VLTAEEDSSKTLDDDELLKRATDLGRVLFSQDKDLLAVTNEWLQDGKDFAGLVYSHQLSISIGQAVRDLELLSKVLEPEDMANRIEYLPYS